VDVRKESGLGGFPYKIPSHSFKVEQEQCYLLNFCQGKWNLSCTPEDFEHSPANYYICGARGDYPVTNYLALDNVDFRNQVIYILL